MKKISQKMIILIVPVVIIALVVGAVVSVGISRNQLEAKMEDNIQTSMTSVENNIRYMLSEPEVTTDSIAAAISSNIQYGDDLMEYESVIKKTVADSDYIIAMGIFMDPEAWGQYKAVEETVEEDADDIEPVDEVVEGQEEPETELVEEQAEESPVAEIDTAGLERLVNYYWVKDGQDVGFLDIGQDTDLRETAWWISLAENGGNYYTETYVDTTIGTLMTSYVVAITDENGNFIGALNTDISMGAVEDMINAYTIGKTGKCYLYQTSGMHLTGVDSEKVLSEDYSILNNTADGLDKVGQEILDADEWSGKVHGENGNFICYSTKFGTYDWILLTLVNENEISSVINGLGSTIFVISFISTIVCALIIILLAKSISRSIVRVEDMADKMADGDFSIEPLQITGQDEIARMTNSLNEMLKSNRQEMLDISSNSKIVGENSEALRKAVNEFEESFKEISYAISSISRAMIDNNSTTEELNASVEEVKEAVSSLADKASESEKMASEIMDRAKQINKDSTKNFDSAMVLTKQYESELNESIENSKVVEEIGIMADAINSIASQINLLSLNASIEAARAGESGRGFAVVATEIGNLASQTSATVSNIQETIIKVKEAVMTLADNSGKIIRYINENVTPDYKNFVDVSVQYEGDAVEIKELSEYVSSIAATLSQTMEEFNNAIQSIAQMSQDTSDSAAEVLSSVGVVSENVENVDVISNNQLRVAQELDEVVARYKL